MTNDYGGEMIFRIYLFGLPFVAFYAAAAFFPPRDFPAVRGATEATPDGSGGTRCTASCTTRRITAAGTGVRGRLYGKEQGNYFSPQEVSAARFVYGIAPRGSLLIGTTSDFPWAFMNFESYDYMRFAMLETKDRQAILDDPAGVLSDIMAAEGHHHAYLLLSRAQVADVEMTGALPRGALARIEQTLIDSPRFTVIYRNPSAVVITLTQPAPEDGGSQPASSGPGAGVSQPPSPSPGTGSPAASSGPGAGVSASPSPGAGVSQPASSEPGASGAQPSPSLGDGGACANLQADVTGLLSTPINFDTDGFTLTEGAQQVLNPVADKLKSCSDFSVVVSGYTDNTGDDAINIPLSANRAKSVADYLVSQGVSVTLSPRRASVRPIRSRTTTPQMGEPRIAASRSPSAKENSTWIPWRSPRRSWEGTAKA